MSTRDRTARAGKGESNKGFLSLVSPGFERQLLNEEGERADWGHEWGAFHDNGVRICEVIRVGHQYGGPHDTRRRRAVD